MNKPRVPFSELTTFGELLRYLRRRARLSQRELSVAVGYSESQICRLESNQRVPDRSSLLALFAQALQIENEPETIQQLVKLADQWHTSPTTGVEQNHLKSDVTSGLLEGISASSRPPSPGSPIPAPLTSFIGRTDELAEICYQLCDIQIRLLTLTGEGGCGKTRLALKTGEQVAQAYEHGVRFVELGHLSDSERVIHAIAVVFGISENGNQPLITKLADFLRSKRTLLILDNCEHLRQVVAEITETLLQRSPGLQILSTSRETLGVPGEMIFRVLPLPLPPTKQSAHLTAAEVESYEAIQLFIERGRNYQRGFMITDQNATVVARICQQLDGIPLAIELAAACLNILHPQQIATRLAENLDILASKMPRRAPYHHQTLRAAIDWSYNLLAESERILLRHLAVFVNGWRLDAVEWITKHTAFPQTDYLELLTSLVNKSLVRVDLQGETEARYQMLETIKSYLVEKLEENNETQAARNCHLDFFLYIAQQADQGIKGPDQVQWISRLDEERENFRTALTWSANNNEAEKGLRLAGALGHYWWMVGGVAEIHWFQTFLKDFESSHPLRHSPTVAKGLTYQGLLHFLMSELQAAYSDWNESLRIYQDLNDPAGIGMNLCWIGAFHENFNIGIEIMQRGLTFSHQAEDSWWIAESYH